MNRCPNCNGTGEVPFNELAWLRDQNEDLLSDVRLHRHRAERLEALLSIFAPPDYSELLSDEMTREFLDSTR